MRPVIHVICGVLVLVATPACERSSSDKSPATRTEADAVLGDADVALKLGRACNECDTIDVLQTTLGKGRTVAFELAVPKASDMNRDKWLTRPDGSAICYAVRATGDGDTRTTRHDYGPGSVYGDDGLRVSFLAPRSNCQRLVARVAPLKVRHFDDVATFGAAKQMSLGRAKKRVTIDATCRDCRPSDKVNDALGDTPLAVVVSRDDDKTSDSWLILSDGSGICFANDTPDARWRAYPHPPGAITVKGKLTRGITDYLFCRRDSPEAARSFVKSPAPKSLTVQSEVTVVFDQLRVRGAQATQPIEDVIWDATADVKSCHDAQLRRQANASGGANLRHATRRNNTQKLKLSWTIKVDGSVKDFVMYDTLSNGGLRQCVTQVFKTLRFQKPGRVEAYVKVPIELGVN